MFGICRLRRVEAKQPSSQAPSATAPALDPEPLEPVDAPMGSSDWADPVAIAPIVLCFPR